MKQFQAGEWRQRHLFKIHVQPPSGSAESHTNQALETTFGSMAKPKSPESTHFSCAACPLLSPGPCGHLALGHALHVVLVGWRHRLSVVPGWHDPGLATQLPQLVEQGGLEGDCMRDCEGLTSGMWVRDAVKERQCVHESSVWRLRSPCTEPV